MAQKKKAARKAAEQKTAKAARGARGASKKAKRFIISKSRTKAAASINVSGEFYAALDDAVRTMIASAEDRAMENGRKTLRPHDL